MASHRNVLVGITQAIQCYGVKKALRLTLLTMGQPKVGEFVGKDMHGNEYYQNRKEVHGRDRWVIFDKWNFDASQVPPEWHQWLHRMTDDVPSEKTLPQAFFTPKHFENLTGTKGAFKTYNTTIPKMSTWSPSVRARE